jgi:hypothetical protein
VRTPPSSSIYWVFHKGVIVVPPRSKLRAVPDDAKPPLSKKAQTVSEAAEGGDLRELLVAMRDRIAKAVAEPNCPPRDLAALTRRLHEIARDIEAIDVHEEESGAEPSADEAWDSSAI